MCNRWAAKMVIGIGVAMCALTGAFASEINSGKWAMQPSDTPGAVTFSLSGRRFNTTSDWPKAAFTGLDLSRPGAQEANFTLTRDAGKFDFEGVLRDGAGAGSFKFVPNARYVQDMKSLGFAAVDDNQMALAIHDVSLDFARDMKKENLSGLDTDKLIAFRIHDVTREFIDGLKAAGLNERDSDNLVAFRIHGVTAAMIQRFRAAGYTPDSEDLIAMRIHGVTPEYISRLQARGIKDLTIDKLVEMKIHGID